MLTWALVVVLLLLPIANYVSFARAIQRAAKRRRAQRIAQGLPPKPSTDRRWKNYTRHTRWDRYSN